LIFTERVRFYLSISDRLELWTSGQLFDKIGNEKLCNVMSICAPQSTVLHVVLCTY